LLRIAVISLQVISIGPWILQYRGENMKCLEDISAAGNKVPITDSAIIRPFGHPDIVGVQLVQVVPTQIEMVRASDNESAVDGVQLQFLDLVA
jgi:hypothetical protein